MRGAGGKGGGGREREGEDKEEKEKWKKKKERETWAQMLSILGTTEDLSRDSPSGRGRQDINLEEVLTP